MIAIAPGVQEGVADMVIAGLVLFYPVSVPDQVLHLLNKPRVFKHLDPALMHIAIE